MLAVDTEVISALGTTVLVSSKSWSFISAPTSCLMHCVCASVLEERKRCIDWLGRIVRFKCSLQGPLYPPRTVQLYLVCELGPCLGRLSHITRAWLDADRTKYLPFGTHPYIWKNKNIRIFVLIFLYWGLRSRIMEGTI